MYFSRNTKMVNPFPIMETISLHDPFVTIFMPYIICATRSNVCDTLSRTWDRQLLLSRLFVCPFVHLVFFGVQSAGVQFSRYVCVHRHVLTHGRMLLKMFGSQHFFDRFQYVKLFWKDTIWVTRVVRHKVFNDGLRPTIVFLLVL